MSPEKEQQSRAVVVCPKAKPGCDCSHARPHAVNGCCQLGSVAYNPRSCCAPCREIQVTVVHHEEPV